MSSLSRSGGHLRILFHFGTSNAPTACMASVLSSGGSHASGIGLKLSFLARTDTSEFRLDCLSLGTKEKDSRDETRGRDILRARTLAMRSGREGWFTWVGEVEAEAEADVDEEMG